MEFGFALLAFSEDERGALNEVAARLLAVVADYAAREGYSLVLDSSSPEGTVLHVAAHVDITDDIVREYDRRHPASGGASPPPS